MGESEKWAAQLRKGTLELAILACLGTEPRYGLEILQVLGQAGLGITEGTLYPLVNRLRGDGLLQSEWRQEGTGNPRKYYTLTGAGRARAEGMAAEWRSFAAAMDTLISTFAKEPRP
jgi:PadR family transcriptional regulator PadR